MQENASCAGETAKECRTGILHVYRHILSANSLLYAIFFYLIEITNNMLTCEMFDEFVLQVQISWEYFWKEKQIQISDCISTIKR